MSITIRIKPGNPRPKLYINDSINGILPMENIES